MARRRDHWTGPNPPEALRKPRRAYLRRGDPVPDDPISQALRAHLLALGRPEDWTGLRRAYNRAAACEADGAHVVEIERVLAWARGDWQEGVVFDDPFRVLRPGSFRQALYRAENT